MKMLSMYQPWASLAVLGFRPYELATFPYRPETDVRVGVYAHRRKVEVDEIEAMIATLQTEHWWRTCVRREALPLLQRWAQKPRLLPIGAILGTVWFAPSLSGYDAALALGGHPLVDHPDHKNTAFAWPLTEPVAFAAPIRRSRREATELGRQLVDFDSAA